MSKQIAIVLDRFLASNDAKIISQHLPVVEALLCANQSAFRCLADANGALLISKLLNRVSTLANHKELAIKCCAWRLITISITQVPASCFSSLDGWSCAIVPFLSKTTLSELELARATEAMSAIFMACRERPDLVREVVNVHLPGSFQALVRLVETRFGDIETSLTEDALCSVLSNLLSWSEVYPSLVKPYAEKLSSFLLSELIWDCNPRCFHVCSRLLVQLCNCAGKSGCGARYQTLVQTAMSTTSVILDRLLAPIDEEPYGTVSWKSLPLKALPLDFLDSVPVLGAWSGKMIELLGSCLAGNLVSAVPVPLADLMDLFERVFNVSEASICKEGALKEHFDISVSFASSLHINFLHVLTNLCQLMGSRMLRYRSRLMEFVRKLMVLATNNIILRESFYNFMQVALLHTDALFAENIGKSLVLMTCQDLILPLHGSNAGNLSEVEQLTSKRGKKRKHAQDREVAASSQSSAVVVSDILRVESLKVLLTLMRRHASFIPETVRGYANKAVLHNMMLLNSSKTLCDQTPSEFVALCRDFLVTSVKSCNSSGGILPSVISTLAGSAFVDDLELLVHPRRPFIQRDPFKPMVAALEIEDEVEVDESEDALEEAAAVEVAGSVAVEVAVVDAIAPVETKSTTNLAVVDAIAPIETKSTANITVTAPLAAKHAAYTVPPALVVEPNAAATENAQVKVVSETASVTNVSVDGESEDDLDDFMIIDAEPDKE